MQYSLSKNEGVVIKHSIFTEKIIFVCIFKVAFFNIFFGAGSLAIGNKALCHSTYYHHFQRQFHPADETQRNKSQQTQNSVYFPECARFCICNLMRTNLDIIWDRVKIPRHIQRNIIIQFIDSHHEQFLQIRFVKISTLIQSGAMMI